MKRILRKIAIAIFGPQRSDYERQWDSSDEDTQPLVRLVLDEFTLRLFCTPGREQARWN